MNASPSPDSSPPVAKIHLAEVRYSLPQMLEELKAEPFPLITSRAFASLLDFVTLTRSLLAPGGVWMALKGQHPAEEIAALQSTHGDIEVFHVEQLSVPGLAAERCIVWMRKRGRAETATGGGEARR